MKIPYHTADLLRSHLRLDRQLRCCFLGNVDCMTATARALDRLVERRLSPGSQMDASRLELKLVEILSDTIWVLRVIRFGRGPAMGVVVSVREREYLECRGVYAEVLEMARFTQNPPENPPSSGATRIVPPSQTWPGCCRFLNPGPPKRYSLMQQCRMGSKSYSLQ